MKGPYAEQRYAWLSTPFKQFVEVFPSATCLLKRNNFEVAVEGGGLWLEGGNTKAF